MGATIATLDFTNADLKPNGKPTIDPQGRPPEKQGGRPAKSLSPKQIRARARRAAQITEDQLENLYGKPLEEWDAEELARGRPRAVDGTFKGKTPSFITRALHEEIMKRFEGIVRTEMNVHTVAALQMIGTILENDEVDDKGRPIVAAGTKLDAAKFLIEHILGKPKQRVETDISVKLQGILGHAMVNPTMDGSGQFALTAGYVEAPSWEDDADVEGDADGG